MSLTRRFFPSALAATPLAFAAPALHAATRIRWRMATSWPKNLPGPGVAAAHVARRVAELSGGRFEIQLFGAGEIVPALQVLDAVGNGTMEMGHSAAFFWQGKMPEANVFTTLPFGAYALEHQSWLERGGGQALWDELYRPFGAKPLLAGNTGPSMAGWFKHDIRSLADVKGLKIRVQGLGGEVWKQLGAVPLSIAPGDLLVALSSGAIDAAEFLAPANDLPLGLHKPAPFYYAPGFNKPNGPAELLVNLGEWEKLPAEFRAILEVAAQEAHARGLGEAQMANSAALVTLVRDHQVQLRRMPKDILAAARREAGNLVEERIGASQIGQRILHSLRAAQHQGQLWRQVTLADAVSLSE